MSATGLSRLEKMQRLRSQGMSMRAIADMLGVSKSTVSRDLSMSTSGESVGATRRRLAALSGRGAGDRPEDGEGPETASAVSLDTLEDVERELDRVYGELDAGSIDPRAPLRVRVLLAKLEHLRRRESGCVGHVDGAEAFQTMKELARTVHLHYRRYWEEEGQPAALEAAYERMIAAFGARLSEWAGPHGLLEEEAA